MQDAGLPDGALNVITGLDHGVADKILADRRLRKLSFTGSTPVGRHLLSQASEHVLRTSMELGGNAPFILFEDADVEGAKGTKMRNMGEVCISANRFIVHESVAEEFTEKFTAYMSGLVVGDGMEKGTDVGPIIGEGDRQKINALVESARNAGGTLLTGGEIPSGRGYFYPPTVITGVPADAEVMTTEIFGRWARSPPSPPRRRRSGSPTRCPWGWPATSTPAMSTASSGWARSWRLAWSAPTSASSRTPPPPSAG